MDGGLVFIILNFIFFVFRVMFKTGGKEFTITNITFNILLINVVCIVFYLTTSTSWTSNSSIASPHKALQVAFTFNGAGSLK